MYRILFVFMMMASILSADELNADKPETRNICQGAFQSNGKLLTISSFDTGEGMSRLIFLDFDSGDTRILHEDKGNWAAGYSLFDLSNVEFHLNCGNDGCVLQSSNQKYYGQRIAIREEPIEFTSANIRMSGTLYIPSGNPPYPAVILLHGSGKLTRYSFGPIPYLFASNGFAVLTYDKRGSGESGGSYDTANFQDFILDGVAALSFLKSRPEIDPLRIGLWGSSQGGFIAAGIASRAGTVRVLINHSGMFTPAWKQETFRIRSEMEAKNDSPKEIQLALDYLSAFFETGKTGSETDWQKTQKLTEELKEKEWFYLLPKAENIAEVVSFWKNDFSFDPVQELRNVHCPVRAVFGGLDRSTPVEETVKNMKEALKHDDFQYVIVEKANHALLQAITGSEQEIPGLKKFAPEAFKVQIKWLKELLAPRQ